ncbi:methionine--tRNA ligase, partial [Mycobacterium tuberculosis]|nr:methionine--tRNA ligase [Mycobacterium tuberculosis]
LAQRTLSMIGKYFDGAVPTPAAYTDADSEILDATSELLPRVRSHFDVQAIHLGLEALWSVLAQTNRYISAQEPWKLAKSDLE